MEDKTKKQLMEEMESLRQEMAGLEQGKAERKKAEEKIKASVKEKEVLVNEIRGRSYY